MNAVTRPCENCKALALDDSDDAEGYTPATPEQVDDLLEGSVCSECGDFVCDTCVDYEYMAMLAKKGRGDGEAMVCLSCSSKFPR